MLTRFGKLALAASAFAAGTGVLAAPAGAQTTSACGGNTFTTCVSLFSSISGSSVTYTVTNTNTAATLPTSVFTLFGFGTNYTFGDAGMLTGITSVSSTSGSFTVTCNVMLSGCADVNSNVANTFNGQGLVGTNFIGFEAVAPPSQNGLTDGQSLTFTLTFDNTTDATNFFNTELSGTQFAIHDQGGPVSGCSTKLVVNSDGSVTSAGQTQTGCGGTTTTPEPSSMALLGTGLVGLVPMIRRRRK